MAHAPTLSVQPDPCPATPTLAVFHAESLGLQYLGGEMSQEHWQGPVEHFEVLTIERPLPVNQDPAEGVEAAYLELFATAKAKGWPNVVRIWQFIPAINAGQGDQERYRRFCVGRANALDAVGLANHRMCAATAIGTEGQRLTLIALLANHPGRSIENPRQISAWQYPRQYGPISPAFARATAVPVTGQDEGTGWAVMVSGTAAVVGHASAYPNDVVAQTEEAMTNVEAVLAQAERCTGEPMAAVGAHTPIRAYLRDPSDWPKVLEVIQQRWPQAPIMGLQGDVCRSELLVELEAWHANPLISSQR